MIVLVHEATCNCNVKDFAKIFLERFLAPKIKDSKHVYFVGQEKFTSFLTQNGNCLSQKGNHII
jgi:hypothetical protein